MQFVIQRGLMLTGAALAAAGCFPTFQSARIDPGFRIEASAIVLADQPRHNTPQGADVIGVLSPSYAFNRHVEIGVPLGFYTEDGLFKSFNADKYALLIMPYLKLGLLPSDSRNHLALIAQSTFIFPSNIGLRFGRDLGTWEPHVGMNFIFPGGEAGDDPAVTRYQERNQTLLAFSAGATLNRPRNVAFEIGVLLNQYEDVSSFTPTSVEYSMFRYYDVFVGMRVNLIGGRR